MAGSGKRESSGTGNSPQEPPEEFLRRFFQAMREWEEYAAVRDEESLTSDDEDEDEDEEDDEVGEAVSDELMEALRRIFREFCTTEEPNRGLSFSVPPQYDPEGEKILEVRPAGDEVKIVTQQTTTLFNHRLVYTLVKRPDGWRLKDDRVYISKHDGKENHLSL